MNSQLMITSQSRLWLLLSPVLAFAATLAFTLNYKITLASGLLTILYILLILILYGLLAFYLWHIWKNDALNTGKKVLWTLLLVFTNVLMQVFYWYRYIRKQQG